MRTGILVLCVVMLLISAIALAAQDEVRPQWWPGEGPGERNAVIGKVTAVSATSISLETRRGPATFAVNERTRVMVRGEQATINDVQVGDHANVRFGVAPDGSRFAIGIHVPKPRAAGRITEISGNTLTLEGREQTWTVTLTAATRIYSPSPGRYEGEPADLRVGYFAAAEGDMQGSNVTASVVRFGPPVIKGVVQSVNGNEIVVMTLRRQPVTATASPATSVLVRPRVGPNKPGTLADVKPGMAVDIGGHMIIAERSLQALWIDLLVAGHPRPEGERPQPAARTRRQ